MEYSRLFQIDNDKHDFIMWSRNHYIQSSQNDLVELVSEALLATTLKISKMPRLVGLAIDIIPSTLGKYIGHGKSARKHQKQFFRALLENDDYHSNLDETIDYFEEIFMHDSAENVFMFQNMVDDKFGVMVHTMYSATKQLNRIREQLDDDELEHLESAGKYFTYAHKFRTITRGMAKFMFSLLLKEYDENFEREHKWLYMDMLKRYFPDRIRKYLKVSPNIPYYLCNKKEVFDSKTALSIEIMEKLSNHESANAVVQKDFAGRHFRFCRAMKETPYEKRSKKGMIKCYKAFDWIFNRGFNPLSHYTSTPYLSSEIIDLYKY